MSRHPETKAKQQANRLLMRARAALRSRRDPRHPMSRVEFADRVNEVLVELYPDRAKNKGGIAAFFVTAAWVGAMERGERTWTGDERRAALRVVAGAGDDRELGLYPPRPRNTHSTRGQSGDAERPVALGNRVVIPRQSHRSVSGLEAVRAALDAAYCPPDGQIRSLPELSTAVESAVRLRLTSNYRRLSASLPDLMDELHRAHLVWGGQRRAAATALLVQAYRAADALADKSGLYDLSARIIEMMTQAAGQTGDELLVATASYVRGELFFANGRPELGRALLERAADRVVPGMDEAASAVYGSLHMRAAILAGQAGQLEQARDHLAEASEYARQVPEGEYQGTAFGSSSVRIHEVTLAIDTGDPDAALRVAQGWDPPDELPGERRSHFYIDVARARHQLGAFDGTIIALFQARAVAAEHTMNHPQIRQLLVELIEAGRATEQVREYARWAGVPVGVR